MKAAPYRVFAGKQPTWEPAESADVLSLGVKNIHLGPTLSAFLSPNVVNVLVNNFGIEFL